MPTNNNINYGPTPLPGTVTSPVLGNNIDRAPAPVPPGVATGTAPVTVTPVVPVQEQPVVVPVPIINDVIPVQEQPVDVGANANAVVGPNITASNQQRYITILANGVVVTNNATTLNFTGSGVSVSALGTAGANITITGGGGGGNGTPGGSDTEVQFNNAGNFGGSAAFTFNRITNALAVTGNVTAGNVLVSNITTTHNIYGNTGTFYGDQYSDGALYVGTPAGTVLGSDVVIQVTADASRYSQTNFQNINSGPRASSDYILTADNGNDTTHFLDMGITSSGWDGSETNALANLVPNNGYLYVQDGNLTVGTRAGNVSYGWNFGTDGTLTFPDNSGHGWPINQQRYGMGNLVSWNDGGWTIGEYNGTTLGTEGIRIDPGIEGSTGISFPGSVNANTQPVQIYNSAGGNIQLYSGNTAYWTFNIDGGLNLPAPGVVRGDNVNVVSNGYVQLQWVDSGNVNIADPNSTGGPTNWFFVDQNGIHLETNVNGVGNSYTLNLDTSGNLSTGGTGGDITLTNGNIVGANNIVLANSITTTGSGGDITMTGGNISNVGNINLLGMVSQNNYNSPNVVTATTSDTNWAYGFYTDNTDFYTQVKFYGNEQSNRGFRVLDTTANTVPFSVDGIGQANVNGNLSATGSVTASTFVGSQININGNLSASGNVIANAFVGNQANVELMAGAYTWTFNDVGSLVAPGDISATGNILAQKATFTGNIAGAGRLDVDSDATIGGNLFVTGNINFSGNVTQITGNSGVFYGNTSTGVGAIYAGKTGYTPLPNTVVQITGDDNSYVQVNLQNTNHGNIASMELAITADDGTDVTNYIDMGIAGSTWDGTQTNSLGTAVAQRDGYLYVQGGSTGGNLVLGTTTAGYSVKFNAGGPNSANTVATISNTGISTTGTITATNIGNVAALNLNGNASTVLYGNGVFAAVAGGSTYGNSNVVTLLSAFGSNTISTTGTITSGNVTGGNILTGGLISATGNITGGNIIATNIGNVAALNLNGNASTILYGNGVFGGITAGTSLVNGTSNVVVTANANVLISANSTANVMDIGADGRVRLGGLKIITGNIAAGDGSIQFAASGLTLTGGNIQLVSGGYIKGPAGYNVIQLNSPENNSARIMGNLAVGASNTGNIYGGNVSVSGNVTVAGTGGISIPNLPAFRVYGNGVTNVSTTTNSTGVLNGNNWAVDFNQGSYLNTSTGTFTAPVAGLYQINLVARVANNTASTAQVLVVKNRASTNISQVMWESAANPTINHFGVSTTSKLAVGDTLNLVVTVGALTFDQNDNWSVAFLG